MRGVWIAPFDRLEVLELTADAAIKVSVIGDISVLPKDIIKKFCDSLNLK